MLVHAEIDSSPSYESPHLDRSRVAARVLELEGLPAAELDARMRKACAHDGASVVELAKHEVSHEQLIEMFRDEGDGEELDCP